MNCTVRPATLGDVDVIFAIGRSDPAFAVSDAISFYERSELVEWVGDPSDNILLVAEYESAVVGFLFCKVMSHHWAMLDNFYVRPEHRGKRFGLALFQELLRGLRGRGVVYLSALASPDDPEVANVIRRLGLARTKGYDWYELFL